MDDSRLYMSAGFTGAPPEVAVTVAADVQFVLGGQALRVIVDKPTARQLAHRILAALGEES